MTAIRLLLADDQALVRGALAALLGLEPDLEVVAQVGRGDEVVQAAIDNVKASLDTKIIPTILNGNPSASPAIPAIPGAFVGAGSFRDVRASRVCRCFLWRSS